MRHSCLHLAEQAGDDEWCVVRENERVVVNVRGRYASGQGPEALAADIEAALAA